MRALVGALLLLFASSASAAPPTPWPSSALHLFVTPLPKGEPDSVVGAIVAGDARTAIEREDFTSIDAMAKDYIEQQARTPAGGWKISWLYSAFDDEDFTDEYPYLRDERLIQKWIAAEPKSGTARIAYSRNLIAHGFYFLRGTDIPKLDGQKRFESYLRKAREDLEGCKAFCRQDPHWYESMLQIAKIQDWPDSRFSKLFNEAADKFPLYYLSYFQAAEHYSPFHGHSYDDLDKFVQDAIGRTSKKEGTIFYARIYGHMAHMLLSDCHCMRVEWWRMYNSLLELNNRYRDIHNTNEFAWQGCFQGDGISVRDLLPEIESRPLEMDVWKSREIFDICKKWATDKFSPQGISPFSPILRPNEPKQTTTL